LLLFLIVHNTGGNGFCGSTAKEVKGAYPGEGGVVT